MELILRFIIEQWVLVIALFICITMLIRNENQKSGPALSPQQAIKIINQEKERIKSVSTIKNLYLHSTMGGYLKNDTKAFFRK